jgi:hypothetical protein
MTDGTPELSPVHMAPRLALGRIIEKHTALQDLALALCEVSGPEDGGWQAGGLREEANEY